MNLPTFQTNRFDTQEAVKTQICNSRRVSPVGNEEFRDVKMQHSGASVLPSKYGGGPHGLGDPNDKSLRKVEYEVMIPKKMREIAKVEKCIDEVRSFTNCCKDNSLLMTFKCKKENSALRDCLTGWYQNEDFKNRCKMEYLEERSEYRRTGISSKQKQRLPMSM